MRPYGGILRLFAASDRVLDAPLIGNVLDFNAEFAFRSNLAEAKSFFEKNSQKAAKNLPN